MTRRPVSVCLSLYANPPLSPNFNTYNGRQVRHSVTIQTVLEVKVTGHSPGVLASKLSSASRSSSNVTRSELLFAIS